MSVTCGGGIGYKYLGGSSFPFRMDKMNSGLAQANALIIIKHLFFLRSYISSYPRLMVELTMDGSDEDICELTNTLSVRKVNVPQYRGLSCCLQRMDPYTPSRSRRSTRKKNLTLSLQKSTQRHATTPTDNDRCLFFSPRSQEPSLLSAKVDSHKMISTTT